MNHLPVYIFSTKERTRDLCIYSYKKLGFQDIIVLEGESSFKEKYIWFAQHASSSGNEYFIRTDSDLIVFDGILKLIQKIKPERSYWIEGQYFDYFMNNRRHGTPHIIPKVAVDVLADNPEIMQNSKKPETGFGKYLRDRNLIKSKSVKVVTSLHEYEQYPSKICNSFLNRLKRGHDSLYNMSFIDEYMPKPYIIAINRAIEIYNSGNLEHPNSMNFLDLGDLNDGFDEIPEDWLEEVYMRLKYVYSLVNRIE